MSFSESGLPCRRVMPDFWLLVKIIQDHVEVYMHARSVILDRNLNSEKDCNQHCIYGTVAPISI